ncbi:hypothetical protein BGZ76_010762 [Entomortierella beljakovae]|nr:hypothetical protein BGZ76_010762 [Entomortierella beljakovae]
MPNSNTTSTLTLRERLRETFVTYAKFGYIAFGGPNAHVAILYDEMVVKRKWVSDQQFAELVAISQALPGPASAKVAYSLALIRSGVICALFAFFLWSIPGAVIMTVVGVLIGSVKGELPLWATRVEQGLSSAAIGLVVLAAYRMSTVLATDKLTRILSLLACGVTILYSSPWLLPSIMVAGGITSFIFDAYLIPSFNKWLIKRKKSSDAASEIDPALEYEDSRSSVPDIIVESNSEALQRQSESLDVNDEQSLDEKDDGQVLHVYSRWFGLACLAVFIALLVAAILVRTTAHSSDANYGQLAATFYFVGSIIFGGGNVVVPLLKTYTVDAGWMTNQQFLIGLAVIQALPGPNFNFSCFLGAVAMANVGRSTIPGSIISFVAIYFPGLILKNAIIPFWQFFRERPSVKMVFRGVNSCALGFIFSAAWLLWVQTTGVGGNDGYHAIIVGTAFVASGLIGVPIPLVIVLGGAMGAIEYAVSDM